MTDLNAKISQIIAGELNVGNHQILAAINLLDEGNTIPFIARYRKEVTGGLDDTQLRHFETRLIYLREMDDR
ncbi:MAG: Tex-like N-terminal domain-containing protein, partial [Mannheimia varigena]|nr:Tex-like N-terminal domain-containing protein [Mannheimia varigena]